MNINFYNGRKAVLLSLVGISLVVITLVIQSCSPTTKIIATWKDPAARPYKSFIVVAIAKDIAVRSEVESRMVARLVDQPGISAVPSSSIFEHFDKGDTLNSKSAQEKMLAEIKQSGFEAIITFALVRKEEKTTYVPGTTYNPGYGYYGPYYGYGYSYYNSPGYYTTDQTYYIESNVYDAATLKLVWSTQSEIFDPSSLKTACNSFTYVMLNALKKGKLIYKATK